MAAWTHCSTACCARGERDDLDGGDHLPRLDHRKWWQRPEGHRFVDEVEPVDPLARENQQSARLGVEIGAPGERCGHRDAGPDRRRSDPPRRVVFADIAGFEPGDDDRRQAGRGDQLDIGRRQHPPFFERRRAELEAVRQDGTRGLGDRDLAEPHAGSAPSPRRSTRIISATIDTATSAGDIPPIGKPTGA